MPEVWDKNLANYGIGDYFYYIGITFCTYMIWSVFYYVMVFIVKKERREKENLETLYGYVIERGDLNTFTMALGEKANPYIYMIWHATTSCVAWFFSALMLRYHWIALTFLFIYILSP